MGSDNLKLWAHTGELASLRDLWNGRAGFLVGSGPSLNSIDHRQLNGRGIVSLGINNSAAWVQTTAFVCADRVRKFSDAIWLDPKMMKFVARKWFGRCVRTKRGGEFKETQIKASQCPNVWAYDRSFWWQPDQFFTRTNACWGVNKQVAKDTRKPKCIFTFWVGLRLMHYLGCRRVYLLGVDFAMKPGKGRREGNYAFAQGGAGDGNNDHYRAAVQLAEELVPVFATDGFEVYNCNKRSRLAAFPHVSFERAIKDCRNQLPSEPFDLEGWYE